MSLLVTRRIQAAPLPTKPMSPGAPSGQRFPSGGSGLGCRNSNVVVM
jgi:hypothetical protein